MAGKKGNIGSRNKLFWLNKGYCETDAIFEARKRMPGTYEYYRYFKNNTDEEAVRLYELWKETKKVTLKNMILKYGEDEGNRRWEKYRDIQSKSNSFEYKQEKHGWTKDQFDEYNKSRAITIENLIKKYGEEIGTSMFKSYCERQSYAGCKLEYFVEKYGEIDGVQKYKEIGKRKSHSMDSYLLRNDNDEELAKIKFDKFWTKKSTSYSKISNELFDSIFPVLIKNGYSEIYYSNNIGEWSIYDKINKRIYFYDFFVKEIGKVIEFNGDYWHANPTIYTENQVISYPNKVKKTANEIWKYDSEKLEVLMKYPFTTDYLIVWESDYLKNKEQILEQCINFLMK